MKDLGNIQQLVREAIKEVVRGGHNSQYVFKRQKGQYRRLVKVEDGYRWLQFDYTRTEEHSTDFLSEGGRAYTYDTIEEALYDIAINASNIVSWIKRFDNFVEFCQFVAEENKEH